MIYPTTFHPVGPFYAGVYLGVMAAAVAFLPAEAGGPEPLVELVALPAPARSLQERMLRALWSVEECAAHIAAFGAEPGARRDRGDCRQPELVAVSDYPVGGRMRLILTVETGALLRREFARRGWCLCEVPLAFLPPFMVAPGGGAEAGPAPAPTTAEPGIEPEAGLLRQLMEEDTTIQDGWGAGAAALALARIARGCRYPETLTGEQQALIERLRPRLLRKALPPA